MKELALLPANTLARASRALLLANTLARASLAAALGAALSGCATIIKGETQTVGVTSPPIGGARCVISRIDGYYRDVMTPGAITVSRSRNDLSVVCTKRGYTEAAKSVSPNFNFVTLGNAVIGGLIGATVDAISGANNSYPSEIEVPMERAPRPAPASSTLPGPSPVS